MKTRDNVRLCLMTVLVAGIAAAQPKVTAVLNNSSSIPAGSPSYGIAQGSLFVVKGTGLGPDQEAFLPDLSKGPLTTSLSGVSVSVTVNGTTVQAPLYYVIAVQVAGVLPSNTPVGTGTITVSFNGQTSATSPITVVASAFGLSAGVLNASKSYGYVTAATAGNPGDTIILWGTGLGASAGDETKFPFPQVDLASKSNVKVYVGGQPATVAYAGRSQFPAVDQINIVVPQGVSGCNVGVIVQTGNFVSNTGTIAVTQSGSVCSDPATTGLTTTDFQGLLNKGSVRIGYIGLGKTTTQTPGLSIGGITLPSSTSSSDFASAGFSQYSAIQFSSTGGFSFTQTSLGSCTTFQFQGSVSSIPTVTLPLVLDGGTFTMKLPNSNNVTLTKSQSGEYLVIGSDAQGSMSPLFIPAAGGLFSFANTGGADVGAISGAQITMPPALNWMNMSDISTVVRSQGVTVKWDTANPYSGFVTISGISISGFTSGSGLVTGFTCLAPFSAGLFNVGPYVLLSLVPGEAIGGISIPTGALSLGLSAPPVKFNALSIDYAILNATSSTGKLVTYQ